MADALASLHGFPESRDNSVGNVPSSAPMLHADIKPKNILCFQVEGQETFHLKVGDFGFSKPVAPDLHLESDNLPPIKTYRAPEQDVEELISLKSDVWCLGCLFLEFVTWSLVGWQGIQSFSDKRHEECDRPEATHALGKTWEDVFFKKEIKRHWWFDGAGLEIDTAVNALPLGQGPKNVVQRVYSLQIKTSVQVGCKVKDNVVKVS